MAQKKITDYQLRSAVDGTCNFIVDDTLQTFRVTGTQLKDFVLPDGGVGTAKIANSSITLAKLAAEVLAKLVPTGVINAFGGTTAPTGWLMCDGSAVSRTTYAALYAAIGNAFGAGDGSTTFNLPDTSGRFLRGVATKTATIVGSGSATSNQATFTAHGYRTGDMISTVAGALSGLTVPGVLYFAIVVDANTLAFSSSPEGAYTNTRVAISGVNTLQITQGMNPDALTSFRSGPGGNTSGVGSTLYDTIQNITGSFAGVNTCGVAGAGAFYVGGSFTGCGQNSQANYIIVFDASRVVRASTETRPKSISVNYIIKT